LSRKLNILNVKVGKRIKDGDALIVHEMFFRNGYLATPFEPKKKARCQKRF
jgi:hypothetical protein